DPNGPDPKRAQMCRAEVRSGGVGLLNRCVSLGSATTIRARDVRREWDVGQPEQPYIYGIIVCMKKTLHIDERLLRNAKSACGAKTDTDTVRLGLEALVRHGAYERLRALRGSEPRARETPRRRERASALNHATA